MSLSGDTRLRRWLGRVPDHWSSTPLKYLLRRRTERGRPDAALLSVYRDHGVVRKDSREDNFNRVGKDLEKYLFVRAGDLVINKMKAWQGSMAVSQHTGIVSPAYFTFAVTASCHGRFLHHLLRSSAYVDEWKRLSAGVRPNQWDLDIDAFGRTPVPLPPCEAQHTIADFLDRKTAAIDALIEKKERLISLLEEKRQALITQAVTKGLDPNVRMKDSGVEWLGKIPAHWDVVSLRRVAELGQGDAFAHALQGKEAGDFPWFKVGDMNRPGNEVEMRTADNYVDSDVAAATRARVFPRGTVIFPRVGAALLTNKRRLLVGPSIVDDNTYGVVPNEHIRPRFLYFVLLLVDMGMFCSAGLVPTVTFSAVKEIVIPLPPAHEQAAIVQRVESELTLIGDLAARTARSIQLLREYRQAVITAAVTGKLDVTSDEAA